jgi:hypothetical protein
MVVNTFIDSNVRLKIFRKFLKVGDSVPFKSGVPVYQNLWWKAAFLGYSGKSFYIFIERIDPLDGRGTLFDFWN